MLCIFIFSIQVWNVIADSGHRSVIRTSLDLGLRTSDRMDRTEVRLSAPKPSVGSNRFLLAHHDPEHKPEDMIPTKFLDSFRFHGCILYLQYYTMGLGYRSVAALHSL